MGLFKYPALSGNSKKIVATAAVLMMLSMPTLINAEENSARINLRDVEIPVLIETVSRITGKNFVVDPRVKGKVTVITSGGVGPDELYETFLSILQVHGFSAVPSGKNLIKVVPSNQAKQQPVPVVGEEDYRRIVTNKTGKNGKKKYNYIKKNKKKRDADELITRVIRVEHVPAAMLVPILRPLVPSTGQLQAYGPSNTIVISDRAGNIDRLINIIRKMDRADDEELEVVPLKYASAKNLAQTIQTLQRSSIKGATSRNKVAADERTNSLLLSGDKSSRQQVRKIIAKLDTPQPIEEKTRVIYLRYAKAEDLAKVLTGYSKTQKSTKPTKKGAAGTQKADVDIQADAATNSLIITADPDIQKNLAKVIRRLDVRRAQVLVEAIIADVSSSLSKRIGIQLATGGASSKIGAGIVSAYSAAGSSLVGILTGNVSSVSDGVTAAVGLGNNGQVNFGLLLNALSGDSATNILSTPSLVAMDNEEAKIVVATNVAFESGSYTSTSGTSGGGSTTPSNPFTTIEHKDVGLTLKIKPQINDGTSIKLEIEQETSNLAASDAGPANRAIDKRTINTKVVVEDGQVLVLGGLIQDDFTDTYQKVPLLGDLPVVGRAFRNKSTRKTKKNLMVFIHPVIMRDVLTGDNYTHQKYNKLKRTQQETRVTKRGILPKGANAFSNDIRRDLLKKLTPEQKKQIIVREQRERELAYKRRIQNAKLAQQKQQQQRMQQQRKAAAMQQTRQQSQRSVTQKAPVKMPQRLKNVVPKHRNAKPVRRSSWDTDGSINGVNF